MSIKQDMEELGLVKICPHIVVSEHRGNIFREPCGLPTIIYGGRCSKHDPTAELVKQEKSRQERTVIQQRKYIEDVLFPKLTKRIQDIVDDPDSKDDAIIKIWQTTMDRIGMAAVSGLIVEGHIAVDAPIDILKSMLRPVTAQDDVIDAEIVDD